MLIGLDKDYAENQRNVLECTYIEFHRISGKYFYNIFACLEIFIQHPAQCTLNYI